MTVTMLANQICSNTQGNYNVEMSPQFLIDCDTTTNNGCDGGNPFIAFLYLETKKLPTELCYPYTSGNTSK